MTTAVDAILIAAMADEAAPFLARATEVGEPVTVGRSVQRMISLAGHPVLLVHSGIGLANAAGAATSAILAARSSDPEANPLVISAGTAGGVAASVLVGDVVVGAEYLTLDADARAFGYQLGQVPGMPPRYGTEADILALIDRTALDGRTIHDGLMVSSDAFVSEDRALRIREQFDGVLSTDMETSAIAQTAHSWGVPFVSVRGISDLCGPVAEDDHLTHVDDAAERSAVVVMSLLSRLPIGA
ncbi:5'-methylthioadenosine/S-adenosylhomocysteine nucleosidase [Lacisediminihabitans changchengi]|uniref:adenosylhomocysteine nucleosidase n=1 Tax=Lacisediminihabitans changchengi TaxID=2787634 RepID=A0A934SP72_9MICO|nr:5'-methylthioadenosine/S-adenosylhomocysteine nucleosidase [Lacisediminihabitans changchengi]MBK4348657.1 5'-methylthioadenosine/S-adenosylhomocysteine nucleosidase [Lacisediminihabitans changchengi]